MKKNVGLLEAYIRMFVGFFVFGKALQHRSTPMLLCSSMQLAAGTTRFCFVYRLLGISTYRQDNPVSVISGKIKNIF